MSTNAGPADTSTTTSQLELLTPPPAKPSESSSNATAPDTRFADSLTYGVYASTPRASSDQPDSPLSAMFGGPYATASARTSYTRVDVDSMPVPDYPPLPPLPAPSTPQDTTTASVPPTPPTNGAQTPVSEPPIPQTPQVSLTFLLVSGNRKTQSFEPETTVGRVKELVWNAWPARDADWEDERPPAPSYLRILYLGKILQDDDTLLRVGFPTSLPSASITPTIVHLSIRPCPLPTDDPALSKKKRLSVAISRRFSSAGVSVARDEEEEDGEGETRRAGCCSGCTIC